MGERKRSVPSIKEKKQDWEVINPAGTIEIKTAQPARRPTTLKGKTILLRWNFKHNGNHYLDRISELLKERVPSAKVVKIYEIDRSTVNQSGSLEDSKRLAKILYGFNPDLVISAHAD